MKYFHAFSHFVADLMLKFDVNVIIRFVLLLKLQFVFWQLTLWIEQLILFTCVTLFI